MKFRNIIYLISFLPLCAMAQGENARHEISMSAGIMTNQAYDTRLTYQYYLNKSIGVGVSFGYYNQWHANHIPQSELHHREWDYWRLSEKDCKPQNIYLEPTLSIKSPTIVQVGSWTFKLGVDLGVMFQLPFTLVSVKYINTTTQKSHQKTYTQAICSGAFGICALLLGSKVIIFSLLLVMDFLILMFTHPIGKSQSKGRHLTISILKRS